MAEFAPPWHPNEAAARGTRVGEPAPGPTNFHLQPGRTSAAEIIGSVRKGLYVTELIGSGVNPVTGDYSRGAAGMWIEAGPLVAVANARVPPSTIYRRMYPFL